MSDIVNLERNPPPKKKKKSQLNQPTCVRISTPGTTDKPKVSQYINRVELITAGPFFFLFFFFNAVML